MPVQVARKSYQAAYSEVVMRKETTAVGPNARQGEHWVYEDTLKVCFGQEFVTWLNDKIDAMEKPTIREFRDTQYRYAPLVVQAAFKDYGQPHTLYRLIYCGTLLTPLRATNINEVPVMALVDKNHNTTRHFFAVVMRPDVQFRYIGFRHLVEFMLSEDIMKQCRELGLSIEHTSLTEGIRQFSKHGLELPFWAEMGLTSPRLSIRFSSGLRIQRFKVSALELDIQPIHEMALGHIQIGIVRSPVMISHGHPVISRYIRLFLPSAHAMKADVVEQLTPHLSLYGMKELEVMFNDQYTIEDTETVVTYHTRDNAEQ